VPATAPILSQMNPVHTLTPNSMKNYCNIIRPLRLDLPKDLVVSGYQTKTLYTFLMSSVGATHPGNLILLDTFALIIFYGENIL
jgi:hypothetical protein